MNIPSTQMGMRKQRGMALIVGLLILGVVALVSVSAMRGSTTQEQMAANNQNQILTFQAAESAIRTVIGEVAGVVDRPAGENQNVFSQAIALGAATPNPPTRTLTNLGSGAESIATVTYGGTAPSPGFSLDVSAGSVVAHQFTITSVGSIDSTGAEATHIQGVERAGPSAL